MSNDNIRDIANEILYSKHPYKYKSNKQSWKNRARKGYNGRSVNAHATRAASEMKILNS